MARYRWVRHEDRLLRDVGILADGTLYNPNNYSEADVRAAVAAVDARRQARRQAGATKAVQTKARRRALRINQTAERLLLNKLTPSNSCSICGRGLSDQASKQRGIGPECLQDVRCAVEWLRTRDGDVSIMEVDVEEKGYADPS